MSDFTSYPSGQSCYNVTGERDGSDIDDVLNITCPGKWQHLLVYTDTANDVKSPTLDFGEVRVLGKHITVEELGSIVNLRQTVEGTCIHI